MKKTFVALVVFLMLCVAAVSAKSSGLGSLGKNLSALSGNAKAAEGTVPEGREILPAIFAVMYSDGSGSEKSDGIMYLSKADFDAGTYTVSQKIIMKGPLGVLQRQDSEIDISVNESQFSVETKKLATCNSDKNGNPKGDWIEATASGKSKLNKILSDEISRNLNLSDKEYAEFENKAYTDFGVLQSVASTSSNKLKAKLWFKKHPVEKKSMETKVLVSSVDESKAENYAYKVSCLYVPLDKKLDPVIVNYYSNNDEVIGFNPDSIVEIKGKISKINFDEYSMTYKISSIDIEE
ncbi:hypothetical protein [uncultured Treponema sp.]|uniref:hypothetical protein n=1 Tax=uncultured Treponema sp. TaxID=162155 RepID=UPI00259A16FE|nr:hypothetical protein [uncultured Treponema sp.]